ncbi:unnamed protein product [Vicia faba]|uniref:Protein kinase domain-containing protein n=1 Tax=Vicia faba TaxID=3906 RepID=A0AAV0Z6J3_VICFA|nr:unnamed protein product [Vicia faba]
MPSFATRFKAAIKKMDMQASKEFLAELKVLTHVHHLNLVRLIGYCVEGSLFLVYEYIENGNLSQHLRGTGRIHYHGQLEDVKSANILIDKNFRGKVADFGLTKLTEYGSSSLQTRLVGTFGYMPPESYISPSDSCFEPNERVKDDSSCGGFGSLDASNGSSISSWM